MFVLFCLLLAKSSLGQYTQPPLQPPYPITYDMAASSAVMICNYSGYQSANSTLGWGIVDFDWSNALADWSASVPMDTSACPIYLCI